MKKRQYKAKTKIMSKQLELQYIDRSEIDPHPWNRKDFDPGKLAELKEDIFKNGIETPLSLRRKPDGRYEIIKGERRWTVAGELSLMTVPAFVAEHNDLDAYLHLLRDNLQREQLSPMQEAASYSRLLGMEDVDGVLFTAARISERLNVEVTLVRQRLKLVDLPPIAREAFIADRIKERHAYIIARQATPRMREEMAIGVTKPTNKAPGEVLTVRETLELEKTMRVDLSKVRWDREDATLVPPEKNAAGKLLCGGKCSACPMLAANDKELQEQLADNPEGKRGKSTGVNPLTCFRPECCDRKGVAYAKRAIAEAKKEGREALPAAEVKGLFPYKESPSHMAYSAPYVRLEEKPDSDALGHYRKEGVPTWKKVIEVAEKRGIQVPVKLCVNPHTQQLEELVTEKVIVEAARKVMPEIFKAGTGGGEKSEAEKKARASQLEREKLDRLVAMAAYGDLGAKIQDKGVGIEEQLLMFELALDHGGSDGIKWMATFLELPRVKGSASGRDYKPAIMEHVTERQHSKTGLEALTFLALISAQMRWQQHRGVDFKRLAKHFGTDVVVIEREQKMALTASKKAKKKNKGEPEGKPKSKSRSAAVSRNEEMINHAERHREGMKPKQMSIEDLADELGLNEEEDLEKTGSAKKTGERQADPEAEAIAFASWKETRSIKKAAEACGKPVDTVKNWHKRRKWTEQAMLE